MGEAVNSAIERLMPQAEKIIFLYHPTITRENVSNALLILPRNPDTGGTPAEKNVRVKTFPGIFVGSGSRKIVFLTI